MTSPIVRGFRNLLRFRGRDSRSEFWPYAGASFALYMGLGPLVIALFLSPLFAQPTGGEFLQAMDSFIVASLLLFILLVTLLAAAISRRLHDTGRSALWALIPLPFVAYSEAMFFRLFAQFRTGAPDLRLFFSVFASNMTYLVAVGCLIILLALPSSSRGDRFE
jgi:uncharacterized membrane protein YhaH (DUF805 family)